MKKQIHLSIGGMACINCQEIIEEGLNSTKGVSKASVSYPKGKADIEYDDSRISEKKIVKTIEGLGYKVLRGDKASSFDIVTALCILFVITVLFYLLQSFGILTRLAPQELAESGMGYGMLFVIGLFTSVHCIAMCGGIGLSQSLPARRAKSDAGSGGSQTFMPSLAYNLGRVCSYTFIGFILGLTGMLISGGSGAGISTRVQGAIKILAGIFMVVMGINMLGIFPGLRSISIPTPHFIAKAIGQKRRTVSRPYIVGMLNGLMPCGPLQSMWILALATGNPLAGALSMFLFSLGTVPLMLGLGSFVSALGRKFTDQVKTAGSVLVVVLGLSMLSQGGELSGWLPTNLLLYLVIALAVSGVLISIPKGKGIMQYASYAASFILVAGAFALWHTGMIVPVSNLNTESNINTESNVNIQADNTSLVTETDAGAVEEVRDPEAETVKEDEPVDRIQPTASVQEINSILVPGRYPDITVKKGLPVRWTIDAAQGTLNGCNGRMIIPDYGIEHTFEFGENVIEFIPEETGLIRYTCWMGMVQGTINVVE